jgi:hypothetical protein
VAPFKHAKLTLVVPTTFLRVAMPVLMYMCPYSNMPAAESVCALAAQPLERSIRYFDSIRH